MKEAQQRGEQFCALLLHVPTWRPARTHTPIHTHTLTNTHYISARPSPPAANFFSLSKRCPCPPCPCPLVTSPAPQAGQCLINLAYQGNKAATSTATSAERNVLLNFNIFATGTNRLVKRQPASHCCCYCVCATVVGLLCVRRPGGGSASIMQFIGAQTHTQWHRKSRCCRPALWRHQSEADRRQKMLNKFYLSINQKCAKCTCVCSRVHGCVCVCNFY